MLENSLVQVIKGDIFTNSRIISDNLEVPHAQVLKTIERIIKRNEKLGSVTKHAKFSEKIIETTFKHGKTGIEFRGYLLNEQSFLRFVMNAGNYDKVWKMQGKVIYAFSQMKQALQNQSNNSWIKAREEGKQLREQETDVIKELIEYAEKQKGEPLSFPLYITYTKMTNKYLQMIVDCKDGKPVRDLASVRDLGFIGIVDDRCKETIIDGMERGLPYKEIFLYAKEEVEKIVSALDFKPKQLINN